MLAQPTVAGSIDQSHSIPRKGCAPPARPRSGGRVVEVEAATQTPTLVRVTAPGHHRLLELKHML
jgi:hypothetical protein